MIKEQFLILLNLNTAEHRRKLMPNLDVMPFPFSKKKKVVGVRFRSDVQYRADSYLDDSRRVVCPWLVTLLRDHFKEETDVIIRPAKRRQPKDGENVHDEGIIVEVLLNDIEFSEDRDKDAIIEKFGKSLAQFFDKTFENEKDAKKSLEKFNDENRGVVQDYVKRHLETGEVRFPESRMNQTIKSKQEEDNMNNQIIELLNANFNVILTGAPGTGKTYTAREVAKEIVGTKLEDNATEDQKKAAKEAEEERIASVQFHPGYDYSDFVIGMKPKLIGEKGKEQVAFDWEKGVFKKFADDAKKALDAAKEKSEEPPKFVFLIDEINRADLSRVFGELFSLLEEEYRYPKNKNGIRLPNGESFVIPENLYIIGTMNDIDRSVESMDFALRRRFAWYEVTAESSKHIIRKKVSENWKGNPERLEEVIGRLEEAMGALNEMIAPKSSKGANVADNQDKKGMPDLRLGSEYQLGGAIFAKFEKYQKDGDDAFRKLWHNHIENILKEYLRGRSDRDGQNGVMNKLKNAYGNAVRVTVDSE